MTGIVDTRRIVLIKYVSADNGSCLGSGLLVGDRQVLTADHVASGTDHEVYFKGGSLPVAEMVRSNDPAVDLAVLILSESAPVIGKLACGAVDRSCLGRVAGCVAVGFPRWKKDRDKRSAAQVNGWIPTAEGLETAADAGLREGLLTLIGDRLPGVPPVPGNLLSGQPGSPWGGMSGAVVTVGDVVIGVVRSHNLAAGSQSLTVTPLTALGELPEALRRRFWDALGVEDPARLVVVSGVPVEDQLTSDLGLSPDVREAYRPTLVVAFGGSDLPEAWTLDELTGLRRKMEADMGGVSKASDVVVSLCEALEAKRVFLAVGGSRLELGQLEVIYQCEIGAWPRSVSADGLLTEAAGAGIIERRSAGSGPLSALVRFVIGVAAVMRFPLQDGGFLARWVESMGGQWPDALAHYRRRLDASAWLVIDLGDEPGRGAALWPTFLTWMLMTRDGVLAGDPVRPEPTADGLRQALAEILRLVPPARPLLVDIVLPHALMDKGIEHWPVIEVDGIGEPLSAECPTRLRWGRRRRDARLHNRLLDRVAQASWDGEALHWRRADPRRACFLGGRDPQSPEDQLRTLLREGCGFMIWFPSGLDNRAVREIARAVRALPVAARRGALPDHLPAFTANRPAVIWDDPQGRGMFQLPPLAAPESP